MRQVEADRREARDSDERRAIGTGVTERITAKVAEEAPTDRPTARSLVEDAVNVSIDAVDRGATLRRSLAGSRSEGSHEKSGSSASEGRLYIAEEKTPRHAERELTEEPLTNTEEGSGLDADADLFEMSVEESEVDDARTVDEEEFYLQPGQVPEDNNAGDDLPDNGDEEDEEDQGLGSELDEEAPSQLVLPEGARHADKNAEKDSDNAEAQDPLGSLGSDFEMEQ